MGENAARLRETQHGQRNLGKFKATQAKAAERATVRGQKSKKQKETDAEAG